MGVPIVFFCPKQYKKREEQIIMEIRLNNNIPPGINGDLQKISITFFSLHNIL